MKIHKNRVLIVGSGNIFEKHLSVIKYLNNKFEIAGIIEKNPKKLKVLKKKFSNKVFCNLNYALDNIDFDLGCILTDSGSHAKLALKFLNRKKSVIIEKPISISLKDAEKIVNLEKKNKKCKIFVVKQNRFNIAITKLKKALMKKKLGKLFLASASVKWMRDKNYYSSASWRGTWKSDGGVLCNQAIHHIDLLQWLAGDIESVFCESLRVSAPIETDDTAVAVLKFNNGATGTIEATTASRPSNLEGSITLMGTKGTVIIGGFSANKIIHWKLINSKKSDKRLFENSENPKNFFAYPHMKFYEYVYEVIKNKKSNFLNAREAIKSLKIVTALVKSSKTGKKVYLNENLYNTSLGK